MNKRILGIVLTAVILLSSPFSFAQAAVQGENTSEVKFSDISDHWSKDAVDDLLNKNAIPFEQDKFLPEKAIKRSEFAVMLHNALDIKIYYFIQPDIKDYFDDIDGNASYASDVIDLATDNIFESGGNFNPEVTLTREEMVHYIMQAYKYKMGNNYAMIKISPATFADVDMITPEYIGDVSMAQHYGLILGTGNNMFEPKKEASRAEAAVIINKLTKLPEGKNLQVTVEPKAIVNDDSIEMSVSIKNNTNNDVYMYNANGQMFDFELIDADNNVLYRWSADRAFIQIVSNTKIEAGKTLEFSDTLSGDAYKAIKDKIVYMKAYITGSADFINSEGYEIKL